MSETEEKRPFDAAQQRLDRALGRLETSIRSLNARVGVLSQLESENQRLASDRARLAGELDRTLARSRRLDESAAEVSRRLVDAMETVKTVLISEEQHTHG